MTTATIGRGLLNLNAIMVEQRYQTPEGRQRWLCVCWRTGVVLSRTYPTGEIPDTGTPEDRYWWHLPPEFSGQDLIDLLGSYVDEFDEVLAGFPDHAEGDYPGWGAPPSWSEFFVRLGDDLLTL